MDNHNPTRADGGVEKHTAHLLTLTLTVDPWHLEIGGAVENLDIAMAMLEQATRAIEQRLRLQALQQMQQQAADAALGAQVREGLKRRM